MKFVGENAVEKTVSLKGRLNLPPSEDKPSFCKQNKALPVAKPMNTKFQSLTLLKSSAIAKKT
jgi:hypothetical protein